MLSEKKVTLDVGGRQFTTFRSTLLKYPETMLGRFFSEENNKIALPDESGRYFFDRNGDYFPFILDFYRNGKIAYPQMIESENFEEELDFWGIPYPQRKKPRLALEELINFSAYQAELANPENKVYIKESLRNLVYHIRHAWRKKTNSGHVMVCVDLNSYVYETILFIVETREIKVPMKSTIGTRTYSYQGKDYPVWTNCLNPYTHGETFVKIIEFTF